MSVEPPPGPSSKPVNKKAKRALNPSPATLKTLKGLGQIQATVRECASVLAVAENTMWNFLSVSPAAREAYERGKDEGRASLRRTQFALARTSAAMAIFLGKNLLGQRDDHGLKHSGSISGYDLTKASDAELDALEAALAPLAVSAGSADADGRAEGEGKTRH